MGRPGLVAGGDHPVNVRELIEDLSTFPDHLLVFIPDDGMDDDGLVQAGEVRRLAGVSWVEIIP